MPVTEVRKTPEMLKIEEREGRDIRDLMLDAYQKGGSAFKAAMLMRISSGAFSNWMTLLGGSIDSRLEFEGWEAAEQPAAGAAR